MPELSSLNIVDIINVDYDTLLANALAIKNKYPNLIDWDMGNVNDPLGVVLEAYLRAIVKEAYFANVIAQEFSLATALTKDAVFEKAYFAGYNPTLRTPSSCLMNLTIAAGTNYTIEPFKLVLKGSNTSGGTVYFENSEQIVLNTEGSQTQLTDVPFLEGRTKTITTTGSNTIYESIFIQDSIIDGSVKLVVNGVEWSEVFAIKDTTLPTDLFYELRHLGSNTYQIVVGDGTNGALFPEGSAITVTYRSGQGTGGNILTYYLDTIFTTPSVRVIGVENRSGTDNASGGQDQEDVEKVRTLAPKLSKIDGSIGNTFDMDVYVNAYSGVGIAKTEEVGFNFLRVYLANETGNPSAPFIAQLKSDIEDRLIRDTGVDIVCCSKISVDLELRIIYDVSYNKTDIESAVQTNLNNFLNPFTYSEDTERKLTFGTDLLTSDVYEEVSAVKGVIGMAIISPTPYSNIVLVNISSTEILTNQGSTFTLTMVPSTDASELRADKTAKWFFQNPKFK